MIFGRLRSGVRSCASRNSPLSERQDAQPLAQPGCSSAALRAVRRRTG